jgi:ATP-dependent DNA helicase RecG
VDELGSGVLNINRLIKEHAGKDAPQFIEGQVFKVELPVSGQMI